MGKLPEFGDFPPGSVLQVSKRNRKSARFASICFHQTGARLGKLLPYSVNAATAEPRIRSSKCGSSE